MLQLLSPMVAVCLTRAQEAREGAAAASDDEARDFWREMERRWMTLAQNYEIAAQTDDLLHKLQIKRFH